MATEKPKMLNKTLICSLLVMAAMVVLIFLKISTWIKAVVIWGTILTTLIYRRGYIAFYQGATLMQSNPKHPNVEKKFRKALKSRLGEEQKAVAGAYFVNRSADFETGIQVLEGLSQSTNTDIRNYSKSSLAVGYYRRGDLDKAIAVLKELLDAGCSNENLFVSLTSYLLEAGNVKEAKSYISQAKNKGFKNDAITDNEGWSQILSGEWEKAEKTYNHVLSGSIPTFPEIFVHGAQTANHFGKKTDALNRLGLGKDAYFSIQTSYTKEYMDQLMLGLENPETTDAFQKVMDENAVAIAKGDKFPGLEMVKPFDGERFVALPPGEGRTTPSEDKPQSDSPNTDLTDDEWKEN